MCKGVRAVIVRALFRYCILPFRLTHGVCDVYKFVKVVE